ncbi:hypothetical protein F0Q45_16265 [Mycobacterium simiae]|uniref:Enoyl-CoA hydratase n=1 Tax=Mycobacterium simiae TaxID=1784 RepID=A0A5B1BQG1_MYCSI|nr:hypothetical protein [Mycobacterium simiae]KAA1249249.1 hypothetical protein F0Q45_16265 [Mycobacterium simiae]
MINLSSAVTPFASFQLGNRVTSGGADMFNLEGQSLLPRSRDFTEGARAFRQQRTPSYTDV